MIKIHSLHSRGRISPNTRQYKARFYSDILALKSRVLLIREDVRNLPVKRQKQVDCSWNVMAHGDAREGKWRGNWWMELVANTLHTTSEHGVFSITTAVTHTSAASSRLNWRPPPIEMDSSVSPKDEIWFLRVCHHISTGLYVPVNSDQRGSIQFWFFFYSVFQWKL